MLPASCYMQIALRNFSVPVQVALFELLFPKVLRASCCGTVYAHALCASRSAQVCASIGTLACEMRAIEA